MSGCSRGQTRPAVSREELLALLEEQRAKFADPRVAHNFRGWNKVMQYHISDFAEYFLIRLVDGAAQAIEPSPAPAERADISYKMDSETLAYLLRTDMLPESYVPQGTYVSLETSSGVNPSS